MPRYNLTGHTITWVTYCTFGSSHCTYLIIGRMSWKSHLTESVNLLHIWAQKNLEHIFNQAYQYHAWSFIFIQAQSRYSSYIIILPLALHDTTVFDKHFQISIFTRRYWGEILVWEPIHKWPGLQSNKCWLFIGIQLPFIEIALKHIQFNKHHPDAHSRLTVQWDGKNRKPCNM